MGGFRSRKWLQVGLASLVGVVIATGAFTAGSHANSLSDARIKLNQSKERQSQDQQRVAYLSSQETKIESELSRLSLEIQSSSTRIDHLRAGIRTSSIQLKRTALAAVQVRKKVLSLNSLLAQRLRVMYEDGSVSYLEVLFSSSSFSDFLSRMSALTLIAKQDQTLLFQVKAQRAKLNAVYRYLSRERASQLAMYGSLSATQRQQSARVSERRAVLADVQQQKAAAIADIQNERGAQQSLAMTIGQLMKTNPSIADTSKLHLGTGAWIWPVPKYFDITSPYGWRNIFGSNEFHNGIDIGAPAGTPIEAVADGVVLYSGTAYGFGHWIVLKHANGLLTIYGHMYASGLLVKPGDVVKQGQVIAYVGADGQATGPHLHFTVATGFDSSGFPVPLDPFNYIHS